MTGDYGDQSGAEAQAAERARRRAEGRRRLRRQRLLAAGAIVLVGGGIIAVVTSSGGGGGGRRARNVTSRSKGGRREVAQESGGEVRNGTPQPGWKPYTGPVPILEYHVLGRPQSEVAYPELYVPRASFRKQMDWLDQQGYEAVTLEAVEEAWYHGGTLPSKPVVISFDDGYRPQYTFALPTLRKHGWPGVLNLKAEGSDLYESNVEAMLTAGWELAAHTINHSDLTTLEAGALEEEVAGSRKILQREYGVPVKNFCYPAGRFDETTIAAVEAAGYVGATTEIPGFATKDHPYELARIEVLGSWTLSDLVAALRT
jgi:peptidoglycan/xylan/chitin deacetylase (PgdA/CDA1 family)